MITQRRKIREALRHTQECSFYFGEESIHFGYTGVVNKENSRLNECEELGISFNEERRRLVIQRINNKIVVYDSLSIGVRITDMLLKIPRIYRDIVWSLCEEAKELFQSEFDYRGFYPKNKWPDMHSYLMLRINKGRLSPYKK